MTADRVQRSLFDSPARIGLQRDIFGQHMLKRAHISRLYSLHTAGEKLPVGLRRLREARAMLAQMLFLPAERTAACRFALAKYTGNLGNFVLKDFTQQEESSLDGLKLLQQ